MSDFESIKVVDSIPPMLKYKYALFWEKLVKVVGENRGKILKASFSSELVAANIASSLYIKIRKGEFKEVERVARRGNDLYIQVREAVEK